MPTTAEIVRTHIGFLNNVSGIREPAFKVINAVQDHNPVHQVMAIATALDAVAAAIGVSPHELLQKVERARRHIDGPFQTHYQAIVAYAKGELLS